MINEKKVFIVMPAYQAEKTLEITISNIFPCFVDGIIVVDDCSNDCTLEIAKKITPHVYQHEKNFGYGRNQKTCYQKALEAGADIIVMLHPDYQYEPKLIGAMVCMIASGVYDVVLGSRMLGNPLNGGMPFYKYLSNKLLTFFQNLLLGQNLSEYHTGYRAYSRQALKSVHWQTNSDNFIFDNEILAQLQYVGCRFGEISCPTKYFPEASSINFFRSLIYGLGVLRVSILYRLKCMNLFHSSLFYRENKFIESSEKTKC